MDFGTLKRRTTDLMDSASKNMPAMPAMPNVNMPNVTMPKMQMPNMLNLSAFQFPSLSSLPGFGPNNSPAMKGSWQHISIPSLPRSSHSLNVIAGTAYVFGGEVHPRQSVDNNMHIINLPVSGAPADYYSVEAKPSSRVQLAESAAPIPEETAYQSTTSPLTDVPLSPPANAPEAPSSSDKGKSTEADVPAPRVGHATAVIGTRIFLFGGQSAASQTLEENGRVWIFETKTHTWSFADPHGDSPVPPARSQFAAVATEKPRDFTIQRSRSESWKEWAEGDSAEVGIPQRPIAGNVAALAKDEEEAGYGTFIIHGGLLADGSRTNDLWAFDVRSRIWKELPSAPGAPRSGAALCLAKSRLYRFGGFDGANEIGGQLDELNLGVGLFNDRVSKGEVGVFPRGDWVSVTPGPVTQGADSAEKAGLVPSPLEEWPSARSVASMHVVVGAGGREYLMLVLGERTPSGGEGDEPANGTYWDDVWAFQLPAAEMTATSLTDALFHAVGRRSSEGKWTRVAMGPFDDEVEADVAGPGARGWFASSGTVDLEEGGIVIFGGINERNMRLGDGWVFRLEY
jgi:hypothetical protein